MIVKRALFAGYLLCLFLPYSLIGGCSPFCKEKDGYSCSVQTTEYGIGTYGWLPYLDGDMTVKGNPAMLDVSLVDLIKESDSLALFVLRLDAQRGRWGAYADFQYGKLGFKNVKAAVPIFRLDMEFEIFMLEIAARYRLCEINHRCFSTTVDCLFGGRFSRYHVSMDLLLGPHVTGSIDWVDPLLGLRWLTRLHRYWDLLLQGDIAGFGIGSDFSWQAQGGLRYHFCLCNQSFTALLLYRALHQNYHTGSSSAGSGVDMLMHGPVIGLMWNF